jgi:hypothetical protein
MKLSEESKELIAFVSVALAVVLIFSYWLFGATGVRVVFGIFFMSLPFYLFLNNFSLTQGEKFVFSLLIGITIFPSLVYLLGLLISFKLSITVVFVVLICLDAVLIYLKTKKSKS